MLKKKNNLICIVMILVALISGVGAISVDYQNNQSPNQTISNLTNPYSNDNSSLPYDNNPYQQTIIDNTSNTNYQISNNTKGIVIGCSLVISIAIIYLIMSKLSNQLVFINQDKKIIFVLASCLLAIVISSSTLSITSCIPSNTSNNTQTTNTNNYI